MLMFQAYDISLPKTVRFSRSHQQFMLVLSCRKLPLVSTLVLSLNFLLNQFIIIYLTLWEDFNFWFQRSRVSFLGRCCLRRLSFSPLSERPPSSCRPPGETTLRLPPQRRMAGTGQEMLWRPTKKNQHVFFTQKCWVAFVAWGTRNDQNLCLYMDYHSSHRNPNSGLSQIWKWKKTSNIISHLEMDYIYIHI